jgi:hypothetical protein
MLRAVSFSLIRSQQQLQSDLTVMRNNRFCSSIVRNNTPLTSMLTKYSMNPTIILNRSNKIVQQMQQKRMMGGDGHMPVPQSENAVLFGGHSTHPEGWETTVHIGYSLSLVLCIFVLFFTPETGIDNWANQEARARLKLKEEHGWTNEMFQFGVHYQNLNDEEIKQHWDKFSSKALKMNEDDDDDDEEEDEEDDDDEEKRT